MCTAFDPVNSSNFEKEKLYTYLPKTGTIPSKMYEENSYSKPSIY